MDVVVNGSGMGTWVLLEREGVLLADADMLAQWRIQPPDQDMAVEHAERTWYPLPRLAGYQAVFDPVEQALQLQFSMDAFKLTRLAPAAHKHIPLSPALWAGFVNYDIALSALPDAVGNTRTLPSGLFEFGITGPGGVLTQSHVVRSSPTREINRPVRLESTYTLDMPEQQLTLRLGDTVTTGAVGSRPLFFGGIQLSRNFALSPGFVTQPVPVLHASASSASTVELYVNDVLRQVSNVPSGPFTLQDASLLSTDGQVRVVVKDVLGRETVMTQALYRHPKLLATGLSDWALEAGAVRYGLGQDASHYGERFVSGHWREGYRPWLTLQAQGQSSQSVHNARVGTAMALPGGWLLETTGAMSAAPTGPGHEYALGLHYSHARKSLTLQSVRSDANYRTLGLTASYRQQQTVGASMAVSAAGQLALQQSRLQNHDASMLTSTAVQYSHLLGGGRLHLNLAQVHGQRRGQSVMLSWVLPLDRAHTRAMAQTSVQHQNGGTTWTAGASQPLMPAQSWGWRALGSVTPTGYASEGGVYHQGEHALMQLDLRTQAQSRYARLGMQGALVAVDQQVFATRPLRSSFALVEVPGQAAVGIALHGQGLTRTNQEGKALVAPLQAFGRNPIALHANDLPIGTEVDTLSLDVVPAWRGAVKARFGVRQGQSALVKVQLENGEDAPLGSRVRIAGDVDAHRVFRVGRKGMVWLTGLPTHSQLKVQWAQQACSALLHIPTTDPGTVWRPDPVRCIQDQP
ncbi:MAG: fimbria/pilus outer membrane usher protein [Limnohabitans sp.]